MKLISSFNHLKQILLFSFFLSFAIISVAQEIDSLEILANSKNIDAKTKLDALENLSWNYSDFDLKKSIYYAKKGIELAKKEKNIEFESKFNRNIGVAYFQFSGIDSSLHYYKIALELAKKCQDESLIGSIYAAYGNLYSTNGKYNLALEYNLKALNIFKN